MADTTPTSLENAAAWNCDKAAYLSRCLRREKNYSNRQEILRCRTRHTANAEYCLKQADNLRQSANG